jgi:O-antigen/teichoic acid export membrane protein
MLSFIKNKQLFTLQAYNFLRQGALLLISVGLAKGHIETSLIAGFETAMLLSTTFSFFVIAGISHSLFPLIGAANENERQLYYRHSFFLLGAIGFIAFLIIMLATPYLSHSYGNYWQLWPALFVLFNSPSFIAENFLVLEHQYRKAILWGIGSFLAQLAVILIPLVYYNNLIAALIGLASLACLRFLGNLILLRKSLFPFNIKKEKLKEILQLSWPVMGSLLLGSGFIYINQFIVKNKTNDLDFTLYRYGTREFPLFAILSNAFGSVFSAKIASSNQPNKVTVLNEGLPRLLHQVFPIAILLMLVSPWLFRILLNETLAPSWYLFNIFLLVVPSKLVFPQSVLMGVRKTEHMLKASLFESISGIILGYIFIEKWGLTGMAFAITIAFCIEKAALLYYCKKEGYNYFNSVKWRTFLLYSFGLIAAFLITFMWFR